MQPISCQGLHGEHREGGGASAGVPSLFRTLGGGGCGLMEMEAFLVVGMACAEQGGRAEGVGSQCRCQQARG